VVSIRPRKEYEFLTDSETLRNPSNSDVCAGDSDGNCGLQKVFAEKTRLALMPCGRESSREYFSSRNESLFVLDDNERSAASDEPANHKSGFRFRQGKTLQRVDPKHYSLCRSSHDEM